LKSLGEGVNTRVSVTHPGASLARVTDTTPGSARNGIAPPPALPCSGRRCARAGHLSHDRSGRVAFRSAGGLSSPGWGARAGGRERLPTGVSRGLSNPVGAQNKGNPPDWKVLRSPFPKGVASQKRGLAGVGNLPGRLLSISSEPFSDQPSRDRTLHHAARFDSRGLAIVSAIRHEISCTVSKPVLPRVIRRCSIPRA